MEERIYVREKYFDLDRLIKDWHSRREKFLSDLESIKISSDKECNQKTIKCNNCLINSLIFNQNCEDSVLICHGIMAGEYYKVIKKPHTSNFLEITKINKVKIVKSSFNNIIINYIIQKELSEIVTTILNFYFCGNTLNTLLRISFPEMNYNELISKYPNSISGIIYQLGSIFSRLSEFEFNFGRPITKEDLIFTTKEFNDGKNSYPFTILLTNFEQSSIKWKNIIVGEISYNNVIEIENKYIRFLNEPLGINSYATIYNFYSILENFKKHSYFMKMFSSENYDFYPRESPKNSLIDIWLYKDIFSRIQNR